MSNVQETDIGIFSAMKMVLVKVCSTTVRSLNSIDNLAQAAEHETGSIADKSLMDRTKFLADHKDQLEQL